MWGHVTFVFVTAANLASHVVILTTVDYILITDHLVTTGVPYQGRAVLLEKGPHAFVFSLWAFRQILVLVAFQSALFTVIFSASAHITLQRCHWSRRRRETIKHLQNTLTLKCLLLTLMCYFFVVLVQGSIYIKAGASYYLFSMFGYTLSKYCYKKSVNKCLNYSSFNWYKIFRFFREGASN